MSVSTSTPTIVLVRHGQTEWSQNGRHTGPTDIPLTEKGRAEAGLLAAALADRSFKLVLTSPLSRAADTCSLSGRAEAEVDPDLAEWDYGEYEGRTTSDIRTGVPGWTVWDHGVPGGETAADVGTRSDRVLARARAAVGDGDGDVALFGHGHALRVLAARWLEQPPTFGQRLVLGTAAICTLGHDRDAPALLTWNDQHHLR